MAGKKKDWGKRFRVPSNGKFRLAQQDPSATPDVHGRKAAKEGLARITERLSEMQEVFYADGRYALLIVLQAMDTGGKDGTIRHVFGPLNPQGVQVTNFKAPTPEELAHDYLWRVHAEVPPRGLIGIFNRSHYEDVLVVRVHDLVPKQETDRRYAQINAFEQYLSRNNVKILKFCLHISRDEQKRRLESRLERSDKHWKFDSGDLAERKYWNAYTRAYDRALSQCSTRWAPWYVIPADDKPYRNYAVARIVMETLQGMDLRYPKPEPGLDEIVIKD